MTTGRNAISLAALAAANKDVIAAFAFAVAPDGTHTVAEAHDDTGLWREVATHVAELGRHVVDGERVWAHLGDAQKCFYARSARHAVVIVIPPGSDFGKSINRTCRRLLPTLGAT